MLRKVPRLASWNKATDPDQVRLREYLEDTAELLAPHLVASNGPWALLLEVGLPPGRDLVDMADLDNYAFPLATRLRNEDLVAVWCTKRHADTSRVLVAPAAETAGPRDTYTVRTTASASTAAYKAQVRAAVLDAAAIPAGAVQLPAGATALASGATQLGEGATELSGGLTQLADGTRQSAGGAGQLAAGGGIVAHAGAQP